MTTADLMTVDLFIRLIPALAALAGAIYAFWHFYGPKLSVTLVSSTGQATRYGQTAAAPPAYFYHVRVKNERKRTRADHVRVLLTRINKSTADGTMPDGELTGSIQLKWQFKPEPCSPLVLGGHSDATANLGYIIKPYGYFQLDICVDPWPQGFPGRLDSNERMRIAVVAVADNARSKSLSIDIEWDGQWSDDAEEMQKHLVITEARSRG